jgi:DNA primase
LDKWGLKVWECPFDPCPNEAYRSRYGDFFEELEGSIVLPLRSAKGDLLGIDVRSIDTKKNSRLLLPEAKWNPVWIGMPQAMFPIWDGKPIFVVEGLFDVLAMLHVVKDGAVLGAGPAHLSYQQMIFLLRWAQDTVYLVFDRDEAGRKGMDEAVQRLSRWGVECKELPYGKTGDDPGLLWDRGGVQSLQKAFPHF